jgi:microcystin-dependent protein
MAEPFLAEIKLFAGNFAPKGWAFCQGQLLSISQNQALFSLVGTMYGGNGTTTFGLPDLRGRVAIGFGQGSGLSNYTQGDKGGVETVTLGPTQMPAHTHPFTPGTLAINAVNAAGNSQSPAGALPATEAVGVTATYSTAAPDSTMAASALTGAPVIGQAGGAQPIPILQPYLALNYIIALQGIFPSRN